MRYSSSLKVSIALTFVAVLSLCLTILFSVSSTTRAVGASITLSLKAGPPTSVTKVSGTGFGTSEKVNINFDTALVGSATTDTTGAFSATVKVPSTALPGTHTIQATGQTSKRTAKATFLVQTLWPMFGYSLHSTRYNLHENVLSTTNVSGLVLDWSVTTGGAITSSPTVYNGVAYIGSADDKLYAVNTSTGTVLWTATTGGAISSTPGEGNGAVYVGSADHKLYAFNHKTGAQLWTFTTNGAITSSPAVGTGVVYIGSADNSIYAINTQNGAKLWSFATGGAITSSPAVVSGVVYAGSGDDKLYAFHL